MTRQTKADPSACREPAASSSPPAQHREDVASASPKRPAGRTKFRETRHPVFRGVRRRGLAGGRVPVGLRGPRAGPPRPQALARHLRRRGGRRARARRRHARAPRLNFPDSAWLLDVPAPPRADVRRAVALAVEGFLRARPAAEDAMSATSGPSPVANDDGAATETEASSSFFSSSPSGSDDAREASPFELDMLSDMGAALYYANLAQALLMEPPPLDAPCVDDSDCDHAAVALWSY